MTAESLTVWGAPIPVEEAAGYLDDDQGELLRWFKEKM
jgi:hypothetical protein